MSKILLKNVEVNHIDRNGYNSIYCFDDCIATIAKKEKTDYQMMYLDYAKFQFDYNTSVANGKVITKDFRLIEAEFYKKLEKYHGLRFVDYREETEERILQIIKQELENERVVIVRLDSYYCEWDVLYGKEHTNHLGLCIGVDEEKVYLCDPFYGIAYIEMASPNFFMANGGWLTTYEVVKKSSSCDDSELKYNVIKNLIENSFWEDRIDNMKKLSKAYGEIFSYEREYKDFEEAMKSFDIILGIVIRTSKYFNMLKYLKNVNSEIQTIMDEIVGSWVVVKNMLFKGFFKQNSKVGKKVQKRIDEIICKEEKIILYMKNTSMYQNDCEINTKDNFINEKLLSSSIDEIFTVPIKEVLNNNSFGDFKDRECKADFSGLNEFLQFDDIQTIICFEGMELPTYITPDNNYDNIECAGQVLNITDKSIFSKVGCIAVSEFGETLDMLKVYYENGTQENLHISVTDVNLEPMYGEEIVWRGVTYQRDENGNASLRLDNAHLYWIEMSMKKECAVDKIELPECSNLHIYGIYFIK